MYIFVNRYNTNTNNNILNNMLDLLKRLKILDKKTIFIRIFYVLICVSFNFCTNDTRSKINLNLKINKKNIENLLKYIDSNMITIPGGSFLMGCELLNNEKCNEDETPAHIVNLSSFKISKIEVTQYLWTQIMGYNPSHFSPTGLGKDKLTENPDFLPVEMISRLQIDTFLYKLNTITKRKFKLPTEAQWEYVARNLGKQNYAYFNQYIASKDTILNNSGNNSKTHIVGSQLPNELGIYDLYGNVSEWCLDRYCHNYFKYVQNDPQGGNQGNNYVIRGNAWISKNAFLKPTRDYYPAYNKHPFIGFRLTE